MTTIPFERSETPGLVSIVIPTHQGARFIGETLESINNQTYRRWEVIVVEDGEPDGTEKIVKEFARRHRWHRVHYSRNDRNYGAAYSRNVAFTKVRGEFVAMLDADDRWLSDHLSVALNALEDSGSDIAYSSTLMIEDQTGLLLGVWGPNEHDLRDFFQSLLGRNFITPSAAVYRRQVLVDVGPWNEEFRCCDDFEFWLRCASAGKKFQYVGGCHCLYRKNHGGAITQNMCGVIEEVASVSRRFMNLPGLRIDTSREYVSNLYVLAAKLHATTDPRFNPTADPSRAPSLFRKAWRLKKNRVGCLWQAAKIGTSQLFQRNEGANHASLSFAEPPSNASV